MGKKLQGTIRVSLADTIQVLEDLIAALHKGDVKVSVGRQCTRLTPGRHVNVTVSGQSEKQGPQESLRIKLSWAKVKQGASGDSWSGSIPPSADQLRTAFRAAIEAADYRRAIEIGESIAASFPDSPMERQFQEVRWHLERRSGGRR